MTTDVRASFLSESTPWAAQTYWSAEFLSSIQLQLILSWSIKWFLFLMQYWFSLSLECSEVPGTRCKTISVYFINTVWNDVIITLALLSSVTVSTHPLLYLLWISIDWSLPDSYSTPRVNPFYTIVLFLPHWKPVDLRWPPTPLNLDILYYKVLKTWMPWRHSCVFVH